MSHEDVELVQRGWDVFLKGIEEGNLGALFDAGIYAPTATLVPTREATGSETYVGRDRFVEWTRNWTESFVDWKIWVEEVVDAGDGRVVSVVHQSAKGRGSGVAVEQRFGVVFTIEDGQVVEHQHYTDPTEAFKVAGLSQAERPRAG